MTESPKNEFDSDIENKTNKIDTMCALCTTSHGEQDIENFIDANPDDPFFQTWECTACGVAPTYLIPADETEKLKIQKFLTNKKRLPNQNNEKK